MTLQARPRSPAWTVRSVTVETEYISRTHAQCLTSLMLAQSHVANVHSIKCSNQSISSCHSFVEVVI